MIESESKKYYFYLIACNEEENANIETILKENSGLFVGKLTFFNQENETIEQQLTKIMSRILSQTSAN